MGPTVGRCFGQPPEPLGALDGLGRLFVPPFVCVPVYASPLLSSRNFSESHFGGTAVGRCFGQPPELLGALDGLGRLQPELPGAEDGFGVTFV